MTSTAKYIGTGALATVSLLACIYNDRAVFDERRAGIKTQAGWPLVGNLPILMEYLMRIHDFLLEGFTRLDDLTLLVLQCTHYATTSTDTLLLEPCLLWVFQDTLAPLILEMWSTF